jgi:poly(A) polymerase
MKKHLTHPVFLIIADEASRLNLDAYVIGGFVRDSILGRDCKDIDIVAVGAVKGDKSVGIMLAEAVAKKMSKENSFLKATVTVFKNFGTAQLKLPDCEVEFVGARRESYSRDSRKPIVEDGSLKDDQDRRDFTINALAISLAKNSYGQLLDPFEGLLDIERKILRFE